MEIVDGDSLMRETFKSPVVQFHVADVGDARREMENKGIEFIGPVYHSEGKGWAYFRVPNSEMYLMAGKYSDLA